MKEKYFSQSKCVLNISMWAINHVSFLFLFNAYICIRLYSYLCMCLHVWGLRNIFNIIGYKYKKIMKEKKGRKKKSRKENICLSFSWNIQIYISNIFASNHLSMLNCCHLKSFFVCRFLSDSWLGFFVPVLCRFWFFFYIKGSLVIVSMVIGDLRVDRCFRYQAWRHQFWLFWTILNIEGYNRSCDYYDIDDMAINHTMYSADESKALESSRWTMKSSQSTKNTLMVECNNLKVNCIWPIYSGHEFESQ